MPQPLLRTATPLAQEGIEPSSSRKCTLASLADPCANSVKRAADSGSPSDQEPSSGGSSEEEEPELEDWELVDELEELEDEDDEAPLSVAFDVAKSRNFSMI